MARTVKDAAYLLHAIAGKNKNDNYTLAQPFDTVPDYVAACNFSALSGKRLGVPRNLIDLVADPMAAPIVPVFNAALKILEEAGAIIVENTNFTGYEALNNGNSSNIVLEADFISDLPREYLSHLVTNPHNIHSLADLRNFTHVFPLEDWPQRDTLIWGDAIALGFNNTSPQFWAAYQTNLLLAGTMGVTGALKNHSLDALLLPTEFSPNFPALIGSPVVTVPLGKYPANTNVTLDGFGTLNATAPNLPFGISFMGPKWSEAMLIGLAYAFEQRTLVRNTVLPYMEPQVELAAVVKKRMAKREI